MAVTVPLGVPLFALACLPFGGFEEIAKLSLPAWAWLALAGVVHFVIGRYGNYRATDALGSTLSGPIQQLSIPISLVLALTFLGETMTILKLTGFILVMVGSLVAVRRSRSSGKHVTGSSFQPRRGEGILWGAVGALGYGSSPLFIMMGLESDDDIVAGLAGGFVSYSAAAIIILVLVLFAGGGRFIRQLDPSAGKWFLASGLLVFLSQMFRYMALAVAPVSVVVPIQRLSVVFRAVFGWFLNRDHEVFSPTVFLGIAMSLLGAIALTLSADAVAAAIPSSWLSLLTLEWP